MEHEEREVAVSRETRYQWIIHVLLILLGFFAGVLFESERIKVQVVTNTVEIRMLKDSLDDIRAKLDMLIEERGTRR